MKNGPDLMVMGTLNDSAVRWITQTGFNTNFYYNSTSSVNSTLRWRVDAGNMIDWECEAEVTGGSSGTATMVLPKPVFNPGAGAYSFVGTATYLDAGVGRMAFDVVYISDVGDGKTCNLVYGRNGGYFNAVSNISPIALGVGDIFALRGRYRAGL